MTIFRPVLALVLAQRGCELLLARANTARLRRQGAVEIDRTGYKWLVLLHAVWLAALVETVPAGHAAAPAAADSFHAAASARIWVIVSLGRCG